MKHHLGTGNSGPDNPAGSNKWDQNLGIILTD